jgi:hypothetical protein
MAAFLKEGTMIVQTKTGRKELKAGEDLTPHISAERIDQLTKRGIVTDKNPLSTDEIVEQAVREDRKK